MRVVLLIGAATLVACADGDPEPVAATVPTIDLERLDEAARAPSRGGEPRTPAYWVQWSTCGPDSQAEVAAANGGRAAGWTLADDLLESPGVGVGSTPVATCEAAVDVLTPDGDDPDEALAAEVLAAELNLAAGAATCDIADEAVVASHAVLVSGAPEDAPNLVTDLTQVLASYNRGELCRL